MEKETDKQTFKFKKKPKKTEKGENIKFFFNDISTNKNNRFATASNRKSSKININQQKEKEEFDFREILLNYVNQTGRTENKSHAKEKNSVIFSKPNEILTLNGESDTNNNNEFSGQISESSSEYKLNNSKRKSLSYSSTDKKTEKMENINNKIKGSNTFTTGANTFNTQNTQHSSFKSLQINLKKFNYDYLNLADISLKKKL